MQADLSAKTAKLNYYLAQLQLPSTVASTDFCALLYSLAGKFPPLARYVGLQKRSRQQVVRLSYNLLWIFFDYIPRLVPAAFLMQIRDVQVMQQKVKICTTIAKLVIWLNVKNAKLSPQLRNRFETFLPKHLQQEDFPLAIVSDDVEEYERWLQSKNQPKTPVPYRQEFQAHFNFEENLYRTRLEGNALKTPYEASFTDEGASSMDSSVLEEERPQNLENSVKAMQKPKGIPKPAQEEKHVNFADEKSSGSS